MNAEEALVLHSKILNMSSGENSYLKILKTWFDKKRPLLDRGKDWFKLQRDFTSLKSTSNQDLLTRWIQKIFGYAFRVS